MNPPFGVTNQRFVGYVLARLNRLSSIKNMRILVPIILRQFTMERAHLNTIGESWIVISSPAVFFIWHPFEWNSMLMPNVCYVSVILFIFLVQSHQSTPEWSPRLRSAWLRRLHSFITISLRIIKPNPSSSKYLSTRLWGMVLGLQIPQSLNA